MIDGWTGEGKLWEQSTRAQVNPPSVSRHHFLPDSLVGSQRIRPSAHFGRVPLAGAAFTVPGTGLYPDTRG